MTTPRIPTALELTYLTMISCFLEDGPSKAELVTLNIGRSAPSRTRAGHYRVIDKLISCGWVDPNFRKGRYHLMLTWRGALEVCLAEDEQIERRPISEAWQSFTQPEA